MTHELPVDHTIACVVCGQPAAKLRHRFGDPLCWTHQRERQIPTVDISDSWPARVPALCERVAVNPQWATLDQLGHVSERLAAGMRSEADRFATGEPVRLLLTGPTGTAKSTTAMALVHELVSVRRVLAPHEVRVYTEHDLLVPGEGEFNRPRNLWGEWPDPKRAGKVDSFDRVRLLVLDELGRGEWGGALSGTRPRIDLFNLIESRGMSVVFTTNEKQEKLAEAVGDDAAYSRLMQLVGRPRRVGEVDLRHAPPAGG